MSGTPPALAVVEVESVARGLFVVDALVKRAPVRLLRADPVTPGKHVTVFVGGEEEVLEALSVAIEQAAEQLVDQLLLPHAHPEIVPALDGVEPPPIDGALGVLELGTVAATLRATDAALKAADVTLAAIHLARGIGGKGYAVFAGSQDSVEACLEAGDDAVDPPLRRGRELIAHPHPDVDWAVGRLAHRR